MCHSGILSLAYLVALGQHGVQLADEFGAALCIPRHQDFLGKLPDPAGAAPAEQLRNHLRLRIFTGGVTTMPRHGDFIIAADSLLLTPAQLKTHAHRSIAHRVLDFSLLIDNLFIICAEQPHFRSFHPRHRKLLIPRSGRGYLHVIGQFLQIIRQQATG